MNNETKHTPGPWQVDALHGVVKTDKGEWIICGEGDWVGTISEANARLIAAAPELLTACNAVDSLFTQYMVIGKNQHVLEPMLEMVRNAIAKAEGK